MRNVERMPMKASSGTLRTMLILAVLVGMPVLAMPDVNRQVTDWLRKQFGGSAQVAAPANLPPGTSFTWPAPPPRPEASGSIPANPSVLPPGQASPLPVTSPQEGIARTSFVETPQEIPPMPVSPELPKLFPAPQRADWPGAEARPQEDKLARVREIRLQLEELGADYVLLESLDDASGTRFRFYCLMFADPMGRSTVPFEATAVKPEMAAEQVLTAVKAWRSPSLPRR